MAAYKSSLLLLTLLLAIHLEASKIVYKKPLYGMGNLIKDKRVKTKPVKLETSSTSSTTTRSTTAAEDWPTAVEFVIMTTPASELEASSESVGAINGTTESPVGEAPYIGLSEGSTRSIQVEPSTSSPLSTTPASSSLASSIPSPPTPGVLVQDNQPVPCTCGVFLSSQIPNGLPTKPLIHQELDHMFPCNAIGRKQCQTKCLETIVQHLPNSANIVCSALGHDCHKERAYLFIKNCHNQWVNTNLQAGREYCCRSGLPYRCPLMG
ncbi:follicle cell protein 3C-1 [Drosophila santomea]|uniref:follicle cell protein 3C-1 n=1 Tax=Drosophila santomea TaxID=129105 RepID=UPI001952EE59|nr:follicle cell protein 3C-1 [Drosophila santomea]